MGSLVKREVDKRILGPSQLESLLESPYTPSGSP